MPYNPGVVDISGQLRAQGTLGAAQAYGGAMQNVVQNYQLYKQKSEADQTMLAKAKSTETFIKNHPELFGGEDAVQQLTTVDPREAPIARYSRLAGVMQDAVTGSKLAQDKAQAEREKTQAAAQQFALQQSQLKAQQEAAQRDKLQQYMKLIAAGQATPQVNQDVYGAASPNDVPAGSPQTLTSRAMDYLKATGRVPDDSATNAMIADTSRQEVAGVRSDAAAAVAEARNQTRTDIENAKRDAEQAKLDAKNAPPKFTQHPETGIWLMTQNGQTQPLPGQVAKDPSMAEIDALEKSKDITHAQAVAAKKNLLNHRATFSPNGLSQLLPALQQMNNGGAAPNVAPGAGGAASDIFGPDGAPASGGVATAMPKFDQSLEGKRVRGPDGRMYLVRNGVPVPL